MSVTGCQLVIKKINQGDQAVNNNPPSKEPLLGPRVLELLFQGEEELTGDLGSSGLLQNTRMNIDLQNDYNKKSKHANKTSTKKLISGN